MMRALFAAACLLLAACGSAWQPGERFATVATSADLASTAYGLSTGAGREANPLLEGNSDGETMARAVALNLLVWWAIHHAGRNLAPEDQRKAWLTYGIIRSLIAGWNVYQINEAR